MEKKEHTARLDIFVMSLFVFKPSKLIITFTLHESSSQCLILLVYQVSVLSIRQDFLMTRQEEFPSIFVLSLEWDQQMKEKGDFFCYIIWLVPLFVLKNSVFGSVYNYFLLRGSQKLRLFLWHFNPISSKGEKTKMKP